MRDTSAHNLATRIVSIDAFAHSLAAQSRDSTLRASSWLLIASGELDLVHESRPNLLLAPNFTYCKIHVQIIITTVVVATTITITRIVKIAK